jgi:Protein of unknown function (DUF1275)
MAIQSPLGARPTVAALLGVQNSTVRHLGAPDLATTVLTLTLAGLTADSALARGTGARPHRRLGSVAAMLAGAAAGAGLLQWSPDAVIALAAGWSPSWAARSWPPGRPAGARLPGPPGGLPPRPTPDRVPLTVASVTSWHRHWGDLLARDELDLGHRVVTAWPGR